MLTSAAFPMLTDGEDPRLFLFCPLPGVLMGKPGTTGIITSLLCCFLAGLQTGHSVAADCNN